MRVKDSIQKIWSGMGLNARLMLPILLIILLSGGTRTYFLVDEDRISAQTDYQQELKEVRRYLAPALVELSITGDYASIQQILQVQVTERADMDRIKWQYGNSSFDVKSPSINLLNAPSWFVRWIALPALVEEAPIAIGGGYGSLKLYFTHVPVLNKIWKRFLTQIQAVLAVMFVMFALIGMILRSNFAALRQLADAAEGFKLGEYNMRVTVRGPAETRAVAGAFNAMAGDVEVLLQSLQESHQAQIEQLHFTQQLLAVLPIPIYFKGVDGVYLGVNEAWEKLFGLQAENFAGKTVHDLYPHSPDIGHWHQTRDTELWRSPGKQIYEIPNPVADGKPLDTIHYKATFTRMDGSLGGLIGAIVDITERKQAEAALYTEKERAEVTLSSIGDAVITTDIDGRVQTLNPVAQQLTGWALQDAKGKPFDEVFNVINESSRQPAENIALRAISGGKGVGDTNIVLLARSGKEFAIEDSAAPIRDKDGKTLGCVMVFHDVSEKRRLIQQISWQAGHDTLTNLPNRVLLGDRLKRAIASAQRQNKLLAVCLLDLDEFKPVNDQYGHEVGDRLLVEVAERLVVALRGGDTVARLGGDEFVLLLNDLKNMDEMDPALTRILTAISTPFVIQGIPIVVSASIGVAIYPFDDSDPDTLMRHADQGMYLAKQSGRNRIRMFDAAQDQLVQERHLKLERVRQALQHGEFVLYYQPKVNMRSGEVIGMEALLRWQHPERGLVGPLDFLPLIEQSDLIVDIGEWVMHEVLAQIAQWAVGGRNLPVSVNIAAHHLQRRDFVARLTEILRRHSSVSPRLLELEILESVALGDIQAIRSVITACQALGVSFSVDDFGTGYSSLTYLKQLPANTLKIDQSFVRNMLDDKEDLALVEGVISLASVFNREVIAEGVETVEHGVMLMRLGCDAAQGYGIARPMPAGEVAEWVRQFVPDPSWNLWADRGWELNNFPLLVAQYDHVKWVKRVLMAIDENAPLQLSQAELTDHHHCRFGHWYYGHGQAQYGNLPEFIAIEAVHDKVHEVGPQIIRLRDEGDMNAAKALCAHLVSLKDQILDLLADLQRAVSRPK